MYNNYMKGVYIMDKSKYVVLDVETNGLSSLKHDLLSISIYKPDDEKFYDRFLPLELNDFVETYWINGIDEELLADKEPLTQEEFDQIIFDFELESRTILTFGSIDEKFIKNYKSTIILLASIIIGAIIGLIFGEKTNIRECQKAFKDVVEYSYKQAQELADDMANFSVERAERK